MKPSVAIFNCCLALLLPTAHAVDDSLILFGKGAQLPPGSPPCYRQPVIVADSTTTTTSPPVLLAFASGRNKTGPSPTLCSDPGDGSPQYLTLRRSTDGGASWGDLQILYTGHTDFYVPFTSSMSSSSVANDDRHRVAFQVGTVVMLTASSDGGKSWSTPTVMQVAGSDQWDSIQPSVGAGIEIEVETETEAQSDAEADSPAASRRIVLPFICHSKTAPPGKDHGACPDCHACLVLSDDGGKSWRIGATAHSPGSREAEIVPLALSRTTATTTTTAATTKAATATTVTTAIYVNARNMGPHPGSRLSARSLDGGETFEGGDFVSQSELLEPCTRNWTGIVAGLTTTATSSLLFSAPADPTARANLTLYRSDDGQGHHWRAAESVYAGPAGYSSLATSGGNRTLLLFENGDRGYADRISFRAFDSP